MSADTEPKVSSPDTALQFAARLQGHRSHMGAPVRRAFVTRGAGDRKSPLGELLSSASTSGGGRGGRTRLALLLSLLWVNSAGEYESSRPARWWAEILGLPDPGTKGARSVTTNFRELERRGFIVVTPGDKGYNSTVRLLTETAPHDAYVVPALAGDSYFRLSERLWTQGTIGELDGPALAMFLILSYYYNAKTHVQEGTWFGSTYFSEQHGLSEATRTKGLATLVKKGVAHMKETFIDVKDEGRGYRTLRRRVYRLEPVYWPPLPTPNPKAGTTPEQPGQPVSGATIGTSTDSNPLAFDPWGSAPSASTPTGVDPWAARRPYE